MRIDFYISNNNHHWQMLSPIMVALKQRGVRVRLVSLCEFRRMETPVQSLADLDIPYVALLNLKKRGLKTASGRSIGGNKGFIRNFLRGLVWLLKLRHEVIRANTSRPTLVVVPNDIAYPFDKICHWFNGKKIPFVLMQEGIRFPLPNEEDGLNYGMNGALKIICWGRHSANYFHSLGIGWDKLIEGGNPRFDASLQVDYSEIRQQINKRFNLGANTILYVSNPIDDQGFCSHEEKMKLFVDFITGMKVYRRMYGLTILVRLHPREDISAFQQAVIQCALDDSVHFVQDYPIFACIQAVQLCVVLASTVGLESAINQVPVAVLALPGHGFVYDYVQTECALGIDFSKDWTDRVWAALSNQQAQWREAGKRYAAQQISNQGKSADYIADQLFTLVQ